jgi:hypothetical protein
VFSSHHGLFIRINPVRHGAEGTDEDVTALRHVLVESDVIPKPEQERQLRASGLPIAALIDSAGNSVHAWVRIDAKPHDNPPADAGGRSPSIPLRACVPPAGPRGRPAGCPQRPSPLTPRILPSQEPRRRTGATAETATNPRPGGPCAPPSPLPHSAPFRSPARQRLLASPAANVLNEPIPAVRDSGPRFRACRARCSPRTADSPGHNELGQPLADSLRPASCAGRL